MSSTNKQTMIHTATAVTANPQKPVPFSKEPDNPILQLQQTIGNRAVQRLLQSGVLQAKLQVGPPNDRYEREADRVADQVMRPPEREEEEEIHTTPIEKAELQKAPDDTIQRSIGFEIELPVPSLGKGLQGNTGFKNKNNQRVTDKIIKFVMGGLAYDTKIGGKDTVYPFYHLTSDHNGIVNRGNIIGQLEEMDYILNPNLKDTSSNLEYVTPPLNELAEGSNQKFEDQGEKLKTHMDDTIKKAKSRKMEQLTTPASEGFFTGIPEDDFKVWLKDDYEALKPVIDEFVNQVQDKVFLQATVGIIPSAMSNLHHQALEKATRGELNVTEVRIDVLRKVEETVNALFNLNDFKNHRAIKAMEKEDPVSLEALKGIIHILFMYIVGDAIHQTTGGTPASVKNAVPFLIKIDYRDIVKRTGTQYLRDNPLPGDLIKIIANHLEKSQYATTKYWTGEEKNNYQDEGGEQLEARPRDHLIIGSYADFVTEALGGNPTGPVNVVVGKKALPNPDTLPKVGDVNVEQESCNQAGIPVEYRWIKMGNQTTAGMRDEMKKMVDEVRELNMKHLSPEDKQKLKNLFEGNKKTSK